MNTFAKTAKRIIFAVTIILAITACTQEDDVSDIFIDRPWTLTRIHDGSTEYNNRGKRYSLLFTENAFSATMPSGSVINGRWEADGNTRKFRCWNIKTAGSIKGDTIAEKMLDMFTEATSYEGDTNWLRIIKKNNNNTYMLFGNN